MEATSVYQTPTGDLNQHANEYADIKFFGFEGRLGRLRYFAYAMGLSLLLQFVLGVFVAVTAAASETLSMVVMGIGAIAIIVVSVGFGIRRLHDLDKSGWWMLLLFVPLVNIGVGLYMLFAQGNQGENQYGLQPPANSTGVKATAIIAGIFFVGSIALAIVAPAMMAGVSG